MLLLYYTADTHDIRDGLGENSKPECLPLNIYTRINQVW